MKKIKLKSIIKFVVLVLQGCLIGAGAILPGISGGVLCVIFGIYQPMMALLSHPIRSFKEYYKLFVPVGIGVAAGFLLLARAVEILFSASSVVAITLFIGLIFGTLPQLFRDSNKEGTADLNKGWAGFTIALVVVFTFLSYLGQAKTVSITPNIGWYIFCGAVWGFSLVIPGLSSSSILIFMGLYQPMTAGIADMNLAVIIPMFAGMAVIIFSTSRLVSKLFEKYYSIISRSVIGIVIAATLLIIPTSAKSILELIFGIIAFAVGFAVARLMDVYGNKIKK